MFLTNEVFKEINRYFSSYMYKSLEWFFIDKENIWILFNLDNLSRPGMKYVNISKNLLTQKTQKFAI